MFKFIPDDKDFDYTDVEEDSESDAAVYTVEDGGVYIDLRYTADPDPWVLSPKEARAIGTALIEAAYAAEAGL